MTKRTSRPAGSTRSTTARTPITLESATALCPTEAQAAAIATAFGLDPVAGDDIFTATRQSLLEAAASLTAHLSEKALAMHLQRIVGAYVGSAFGAGGFYSGRVTAARDLTSRLANDQRDEDRDGPVGFQSRAQRAREFAAQAGLQAHAVLVAAQGAVSAYAHLTGEDWKPYAGQQQPVGEAVSRQAAEEQLAAFG
jgi:hypothetical protein